MKIVYARDADDSGNFAWAELQEKLMKNLGKQNNVTLHHNQD